MNADEYDNESFKMQIRSAVTRTFLEPGEHQKTPNSSKETPNNSKLNYSTQSNKV